ncbi:DUF308 domain-containing protein [Pseudonocardia alni]|uniref:DUF308 domain-containing protein n=2 Tax=Pseudonocardia TaxID=1847 RepID=A0A852WG57_PSEA5|nr:DUF308 domain-containing protein [Pseudonocardia antarctica]NYG04596.1 hypothetical protein [Pseudonocardia antarctica]
MSSADPSRDREDRPDDFDAIVAAWRDEGSVPDWPAEPVERTDRTDRGDAGDVAGAAGGADRPAHRSGPAAPHPGTGTGADPDDHYHPPEPPPLPRPGPPAVVGGGLIGVGLLLCIAPGLIGVGGTWPLPLGLVLIAAGLGWLLLRLWSPDSDEGPDPWDDGSRL